MGDPGQVATLWARAQYLGSTENGTPVIQAIARRYTDRATPEPFIHDNVVSAGHDS